MYDWVASGSIWYRHFLRFIGVPPEKLQWWIGDVDEPRIANHVYTLPDGVHRGAGGALAVGDADRRRTRRDLQPAAAAAHTIRWTGRSCGCSPTSARSSATTSARTRMFPPQHLMVLRREVWEQQVDRARADRRVHPLQRPASPMAQRSFPYASPWLDAELEETEALMGADFHPYGFEKNRATIDVQPSRRTRRDRRPPDQRGRVLRRVLTSA